MASLGGQHEAARMGAGLLPESALDPVFHELRALPVRAPRDVGATPFRSLLATPSLGAIL